MLSLIFVLLKKFFNIEMNTVAKNNKFVNVFKYIGSYESLGFSKKFNIYVSVFEFLFYFITFKSWACIVVISNSVVKINANFLINLSILMYVSYKNRGILQKKNIQTQLLQFFMPMLYDGVVDITIFA